MKKGPPRAKSGTYTRHVQHLVEQGGERLWRFNDFPGLPVAAIAQALSRLARRGIVQRLSKGVYYRSTPTVFGPSLPNPAVMRRLAYKSNDAFPAGVSAANLLGFSTQNPRHGEVATRGFALPRKLLGPDTVVHTRRPDAWSRLSDTDGALLDFLRRAGKTSELSAQETVRRITRLLGEKGRFERLLTVAASEPPRVRALLGAIGEELGQDPKTLRKLRASLNPVSRFDFGLFAGLKHGPAWQAKVPRS